MKFRGAPVFFLVEGVVLYAFRRARASRAYLTAMVGTPPGGVAQLPDALTRATQVCDSALRRVGATCVWRASVLTEMLRRRGYAANVLLSIAPFDPRDAHAECQVGGRPVRDEGHSRIALH